MTTNTQQDRPAIRESPKARAAFDAYCNQEKRSLRDLADEIGVSFNTIKGWNQRFGWQERVKQYDADIAAAARQAAQKEARNLARRRLRNSGIMQDAGLTVLSKAKINELSTEDARALLPTAVKLLKEGLMIERLEMGESTNNFSVQAMQPKKALVEMTDEELDEYLARIEAIA
jgi:hypothetical protein